MSINFRFDIWEGYSEFSNNYPNAQTTHDDCLGSVYMASCYTKVLHVDQGESKVVQGTRVPLNFEK
jgi:hypothetical protein